MRGIVYDGTNTEPVDGLEVRAPGPRDVIVEIAAAGGCSAPYIAQRGIR